MRRITLLLLTLALISGYGIKNSAAQSGEVQHELRAQVSDGFPLVIMNNIVFGVTNAFNSMSGYKAKEDGGDIIGHYGLGYKYHVTSRFNTGLDVSFQSSTVNYELTHPSEETRSGKRKFNMFLIMPTAELKYLDRTKVKLYGNVAMGVGFLSYTETVERDGTDYDDSVASFAFQLNPIGIRVGQRIAGFAELGFGYKGFASLGVSMQF